MRPIAALILFLLTGCVPEAGLPYTNATYPSWEGPAVAEPTVEIPDATWPPIYFESIDERTDALGLGRLRTVKLPADALEVRIWEGFGLQQLEGFILRRNPGGDWSAWHVPEQYLPRLSRARGVDAKEIFRQLVDLGLLTLPDHTTLPDEAVVLDGTGYVIELHDGESYRTYLYSNPSYQDWPEAEAVLAIAEILHDAFDASNPG